MFALIPTETTFLLVLSRVWPKKRALTHTLYTRLQNIDPVANRPWQVGLCQNVPLPRPTNSKVTSPIVYLMVWKRLIVVVLCFSAPKESNKPSKTAGAKRKSSTRYVIRNSTMVIFLLTF